MGIVALFVQRLKSGGRRGSGPQTRVPAFIQNARRRSTGGHFDITGSALLAATPVVVSMAVALAAQAVAVANAATAASPELVGRRIVAFVTAGMLTGHGRSGESRDCDSGE
jgi:hypothetical protein